MKHTAWIVVIVAVALILLGGGFYLRYSSSPKIDVGAQAPSGTLPAVVSTSSPTAPAGQANNAVQNSSFGLAADAEALDYFVDAQNILWLIQPDGIVNKVSIGKSASASTAKVDGIVSAKFSFDGKKVLVSASTGKRVVWSVYDVAANSWTALSAGIENAVWSPADLRIAYATEKNSLSSLQTLDLSKKVSPRTFAVLAIQDPLLVWGDAKTVFVTQKPGAAAAADIFKINLSTGFVSLWKKELKGAELLWGLAAKQGLLWSTSQSGGSLSLLDQSGAVLHTLGVITLPSKCVFSSVSASSTPLICGVPRDRTRLGLAALPDDYEQRALYTADDIYSTNILTGNLSQVFTDAKYSFDISSPKVFGGNLFFINRLDNKIYALSLSK